MKNLLPHFATTADGDARGGMVRQLPDGRFEYSARGGVRGIVDDHDEAVAILAAMRLPRARPRPKLGLPPPVKITSGPPVPSSVLTAKAESFSVRKGAGKGSFAAAAAFRTLGGRYVASAGETMTTHRSPATAQAAALKALKKEGARKRAEKRAKREAKRETTTPVEGDSQ